MDTKAERQMEEFDMAREKHEKNLLVIGVHIIIVLYFIINIIVTVTIIICMIGLGYE